MATCDGRTQKKITEQSLQLSAKEKRRLEADLLTFLLLASAPKNHPLIDSSTPPMLNHLVRLIRRFFSSTSASASASVENKHCAILPFESRLYALTDALIDCGIPFAIAERNAIALLSIFPDFDLYSPNYKNIKFVLDHHKKEWLNAFVAVRQSRGISAANAWLSMMREEEIFFARIASFSPNVAINTLFSNW